MGAMKSKWMAMAMASGALLGGCASSAQEDQCYQNLGACLLVGTVQTAAYVGAAALRERHHGEHHQHKKGKR
jgi:uncharacterized lipoprotein YmbA